ncbi:MAG: hypothetical protein AMXMBFR33_42940 [Candidatus Xenobia bacterium]
MRVPTTFFMFHLVGFALLTSLATVFFGIFIYTGDPQLILVSMSCLATAVLLIPAVMRRGQDYDLMEPINFAIPAVFFGTTLKTLFIVLYPSERTTNFLMIGYSNDILYGPMVCICLGLLCMVIGYCLPVPTMPVALFTNLLKNRQWSPWRLRLTMVFSFALAVFCAITFIRALGPLALLQLSAKRRLSPENDEHGGLLLMGVAQLTFCCYYCFIQIITNRRGTWPERVMLLISWAFLGAFYTFTSTRTLILNMVVYCLLMTHYLKGQIRVQHALLSLGFILAVVAFIGGLRASPQNRNPGIMDSLTQGTSRFVELSVTNRNYLGSPETAIILTTVPNQLNWQYGKTMITWAYFPIPRAAWAGKPERLRVGFLLSPLFKRRTDLTGATPGVVAELYVNFGYFGIFPGMLLVGMVLRSLYLTFRPHLNNRNIVMVYMVTAFPLGYTYAASDLSGAVITTMQGVFFILVFLFLISRKASPQKATGPP